MTSLKRTRSGPSRRTVLQGALGTAIAIPALALTGSVRLRAQFQANPFSLGIASGEPAADGFVIWTRLAPEPLRPRGGMMLNPVEVGWDIGTDPALKQVVRSGTAIARVEVAHSVHVEVAGLEPARDYFYRFKTGEAQSPVGRARTLPLAGADVARLKFAVAGCQSWEGGYYTAWRKLAEESLDFVFHYGDYIYERGRILVERENRPVNRTMPEGFPLCMTLTDYRQRYGLYKGDPDLQAAHASCCFLPSFDDHEVANNWAAEHHGVTTPAEAFLFRRAAAFQAWYEHQPVRASMVPRGPDMRAHRSFSFGKVADIAVLDTRQYRSLQACGGPGIRPLCEEVEAPARTMLGEAQERWLAGQLQANKGMWQVLAQQILFSPMNWRSFPWVRTTEPARNMDAWDGTAAARDRVLGMIRNGGHKNPVVLTGDAHMGLAFELKEDHRQPNSPTMGVEFLSTSISSGGDGSVLLEHDEALRRDNPNLKFAGNERGYTRHTVTPSRWQADYVAVERVSTPGAGGVTRKSFIVEAGRPGLLEIG